MNILFDCCFWAVLLISSILSLRMRYHSKTKTYLRRIIHGLSSIIALSFILWQLALWTVPKGNKIEEGIRLPRHFWNLENKHIGTTPTAEKIAYGNDEKQYFVYYPASKKSDNNVAIFYWHGGGWHTGSPNQHRHLAALLHQQGYPIIMPAYRLGPVYGYPEMKADVDSALVKGLRVLQQRGLSNVKLIVGGTSAGSTLAASLAFDKDRWSRLGLSRSSLLGYFGIVSVLNLDKLAHSQLIQNYAGEKKSQQYKKANPITYISRDDTIPTLCLHGTKDGLAPISNTLSFCQKLRKTVNSELVSFHSFENKTHLEVGSIWYYDASCNYGQDSILTTWLAELIEAEDIEVE